MKYGSSKTTLLIGLAGFVLGIACTGSKGGSGDGSTTSPTNPGQPTSPADPSPVCPAQNPNHLTLSIPNTGLPLSLLQIDGDNDVIDDLVNGGANDMFASAVDGSTWISNDEMWITTYSVQGLNQVYRIRPNEDYIEANGLSIATGIDEIVQVHYGNGSTDANLSFAVTDVTNDECAVQWRSGTVTLSPLPDLIPIVPLVPVGGGGGLKGLDASHSDTSYIDAESQLY